MKLVVDKPIQCYNCNWTGIHKLLKNGKCPECAGTKFNNYKGLVVIKALNINGKIKEGVLKKWID